MIRLIFDADLGMCNPDRMITAVNKIKTVFSDVIAIPEKDQRLTIIIKSTDMQAYDFVTNNMTRATNYAICATCQTIHFKTERTCLDLFRCRCGKYVNDKINKNRLPA